MSNFLVMCQNLSLSFAGGLIPRQGIDFSFFLTHPTHSLITSW
ncbi:hypothetical protein PARMER_01510 [Parabacteroides merdae ATCC 43184]|nr:hypothetical protein PARMER_01510 [Parabacteroides merdae ATCC 43184]